MSWKPGLKPPVNLVPCGVCERPFPITKSEAKTRLKTSKSGRLYCSKECTRKHLVAVKAEAAKREERMSELRSKTLRELHAKSAGREECFREGYEFAQAEVAILREALEGYLPVGYDGGRSGFHEGQAAFAALAKAVAERRRRE